MEFANGNDTGLDEQDQVDIVSGGCGSSRSGWWPSASCSPRSIATTFSSSRLNGRKFRLITRPLERTDVRDVLH
jgi:hypothetical protein